jgi:hypothetical protein
MGRSLPLFGAVRARVDGSWMACLNTGGGLYVPLRALGIAG